MIRLSRCLLCLLDLGLGRDLVVQPRQMCQIAPAQSAAADGTGGFAFFFDFRANRLGHQTGLTGQKAVFLCHGNAVRPNRVLRQSFQPRFPGKQGGLFSVELVPDI